MSSYGRLLGVGGLLGCGGQFRLGWAGGWRWSGRFARTGGGRRGNFLPIRGQFGRLLGFGRCLGLGDAVGRRGLHLGCLLFGGLLGGLGIGGTPATLQFCGCNTKV